MKAVIQRVKRAAVRVEGQTVGEIGAGLLVLLGIGKSDTPAETDWMINKLLTLRIFPDDAGKMNRSVTDTAGSLLVVSQFTLYGVLEKGTRPSFSTAMSPVEAEKFYNEFMQKLRATTALPVAEGKFAAMMDVELINDGPVTIIVETPRRVEQASRLCEGDAAKNTDPNRTGGMPVQQRASAPFIAFDRRSPVAMSRRELPHWKQTGCTYFVTFRLVGSVPAEKIRQWEAFLDKSEAFCELQNWLDRGDGACWLKQPNLAALVESSLRHFDGQRYQLGAFVVMPNHVHVLVTPLGEHELADILHSWKSYTAHQINRALQRTGPVWQDESFDHLVRDETALQQFADYIAGNPTRAGLNEGEYRVGKGGC
jgi:D-tyrosyl-tRNA(Tyr) deacylase